MTYTFDMTGKRAIITGGAGDIGSAIAREMHRLGAEIAIVDVSRNIMEKCREIESDGGAPVHGITANLLDRGDVRKAFQECLDAMHGVDILVNAAGICRRGESSEEFSEKDWDEVLEINLTGTFLFSQMAGKEMLKNGFGRIINFASMNSFFGGLQIPSYAASKGAVSLITKSLSNEWASKGVTVNAVAPGYIATQLNPFYRTPAGAEQNKIIVSRIPAGRWGKPEDIVGPVLFFASPAADYVTGVTLPVDGGYMGR
ncbi:MAG: SDR family oxidoreductase [Clostridiales bacterium]|nr:SDR family oxidoreductase [Clostridiales bacterium]